MTARAIFHETLAPLLPKRWTVLDHTPSKGAVERVSVWMQQTRVARNPQAPKSQNDTTITLTLVEPSTDVPAADNKLDDNLDVLLTALDKVINIRIGDAERSTVDNTYPAYSIPLTMLTERN